MKDPTRARRQGGGVDCVRRVSEEVVDWLHIRRGTRTEMTVHFMSLGLDCVHKVHKL